MIYYKVEVTQIAKKLHEAINDLSFSRLSNLYAMMIS